MLLSWEKNEDPLTDLKFSKAFPSHTGRNISHLQDKLDRARLIPYHMHINVDVIECVYLICSMLLEIPRVASQQHEMRRKLLSRSFHYHLKQVVPSFCFHYDLTAGLTSLVCGSPFAVYCSGFTLCAHSISGCDEWADGRRVWRSSILCSFRVFQLQSVVRWTDTYVCPCEFLYACLPHGFNSRMNKTRAMGFIRICAHAEWPCVSPLGGLGSGVLCGKLKMKIVLCDTCWGRMLSETLKFDIPLHSLCFELNMLWTLASFKINCFSWKGILWLVLPKALVST